MENQNRNSQQNQTKLKLETHKKQKYYFPFICLKFLCKFILWESQRHQ